MPKAEILVCAAVLLGLTASANAQHHQHSNPRPTAHAVAPSAPFAVTAHGAFKRMMHTQDFSSKVQLKSVMSEGTTEAVGAASGLRGEITAIDGKLLLTYGNPCAACGHPGEDHATLLATAKVTAWRQPVQVPSDLAGSAVDMWIIAQAKTAGMDTSKPFPVRLKGTLTGVRMHVLRAANPGFKGHGSGHHMADQEDIAVEKIDGEIVGFYAPVDQQGIITHPGDPFHYHWVDIARTRTAHLDAFGMAKGSLLLLPQQ